MDVLDESVTKNIALTNPNKQKLVDWIEFLFTNLPSSSVSDSRRACSLAQCT